MPIANRLILMTSTSVWPNIIESILILHDHCWSTSRKSKKNQLNAQHAFREGNENDRASRLHTATTEVCKRGPQHSNVSYTFTDKLVLLAVEGRRSAESPWKHHNRRIPRCSTKM